MKRALLLLTLSAILAAAAAPARAGVMDIPVAQPGGTALEASARTSESVTREYPSSLWAVLLAASESVQRFFGITG